MRSDQAHAVIVNPFANGGRSWGRWKQFLGTSVAKNTGLSQAKLFDARSHSDRYRLEQELSAWILDRAQEGRRNFVAAGGDGTVHFVLNCLMNLREFYPEIQESRLGAIGLGSTNSFHRPFLPHRREIETQIYYRLNFEGALLHDVGTVQTPVTHYFIVNSKVGMTAQAHLFFNEGGAPWFKSLKNLSLEVANAFAAAREFYQFQSLPMRITSGGCSSRSVELMNLGVLPNEGKLGIYICEGMGKLELLKTLISISQGKSFNLPHTHRFESQELKVDSCTPFALEIDGEVRRVRVAQFKVLPENILLCP